MIETDAQGNVTRFACTIRCTPPSKKNSWGPVIVNGHASIAPTYEFTKVTAEAVRQIREAWGERDALAGRFWVKMAFHILYRSDAGNAPDLPNLIDILDWFGPPKLNRKTKAVATPGANIIADDRLVDSVDGSRRVFECDGCSDRKRGCNYRFETRLKKNGEPWCDRRGKPKKMKLQICQRAKIEIQLTVTMRCH